MSQPARTSEAERETSVGVRARFGWLPAHQGQVSALLALCACALMIAAALDLRTANMQRLIAPGVLKLLTGALALGVALRLKPQLPALALPAILPLSPARRGWWLFVGAGALLLALLAEINGALLRMLALKEVSTHAQFGLLVAGIALLVYGFSGASAFVRPRLSVSGRSLLPLVAILALAFLLRAWNLDGTLRVLIDELHWSDAILAVEGRPTLRLLTPMSGQSPYTWLFPYWQSGMVALLGHNFVGFRMLSAIIGTLTVLATYGLARTLFDRRAALIAALLLATFPPHVHFSRVAMTLIADPLFGTLALMFTARALRSNRRADWALAGAALGMTQYFYEGGRLLYPPLVAAFVALAALRGGMRGKGRGLLILLAAAVIVGAPVYYTIVAEGKPLFGRYDDSGLGWSYWRQLAADGVSLEDLGAQASHLLSSFMIYGAHRDLSVYYGGQQALILDYLLPFFLLGCCYLLGRYPALAFVVPLWVAATALGNGLLRDTLVSARYYVVLPALALAIAAGVRYGLAPLLEGETSFSPTRRARLARAFPVIAAVAIAAAQVGYYFGPHLAYFNVQVRDSKGYRDGIDAALRTLELPGNTQVYLVGKPEHDVNVPRSWLGFLSRDGDPMRYFPLRSVQPDVISHKFLRGLPRGINYAFFVAPDEDNVMRLLARYFPDADAPQYSLSAVPAHREYVLFFVPSAAIPPRESGK